MPLLILHGDNQVKSREYVSSQTEKAKSQEIEIISLNGATLTETALIEACETHSFFSLKRLLVIENLFKQTSKATLKKITTYLSTLDPKTQDVIIWENHALTAAQLKTLPHYVTQLFKTSPVVFRFLDALYPQNQAAFLPLYKTACATDSAEFVFIMLVRQVRLLIEVGEPTFKAAPWQVQKLKKQREHFEDSQLFGLHAVLADLDYHHKSGRLISPLEGELGYLLAKM